MNVADVRQSLIGTPLFVPARAMYRAVFKPSQFWERRKLVSFYKHLVPNGGLVFDVGANQGEYAEIFSDAGGKVIAIEPNPAFQDRLFSLAKRFNISPEFCAVGDNPGTATLNVCSAPGYSTLLPKSDHLFSDSPDHKNISWVREVSVPVRTLDQLAAQYGVPTFIKIDVEGFEREVLAGMSFSPEYLTFEFRHVQKHHATDCIKLLGERGYRFSPIMGRSPTWRAEMMSEQDVLGWLDRYDGSEATYGDMLARRA